MNNNPLLASKREIVFFFALAVLLIAFLFASFILTKNIRESRTPKLTILNTEPFKNVNLAAKAAYVLDVRTGQVLYQKNEDSRLALASLTKVMTALVALDSLPSDTTITIERNSLLAEGDSGLKVGERWTLKDLIGFTLTTSSNDGARAIATSVGAIGLNKPDLDSVISNFVRMMNKKAESLGLKNTYFLNETGLDLSPDKAGAYGSAKDISLLFSYMLTNHPEALSATRFARIYTPSLEENHLAKNTDILVSNIPGILGSKTGSTDLAGGNLVIAFDPELNRPIVIGILGSTDKNRFEDASVLIEATLRSIGLDPVPVESSN